MKVVVNDTNIFIDMYSIGLLEKMCRLPYAIHTVDFIEAEITDPDQKKAFLYLSGRGLIVVNSFTAAEVLDIVNEHATVSGNLSIPDCSVCYYARKHRIPILTGDRRLRKYAELASIEVHGILFLFDEMVAHGVIPPDEAADKLIELMNRNIRLPKNAISERIDRWRK